MTTRAQADSIDTKDLMAILDTVKAPIILLDPTYHIIALNEQANHLFGLDSTALEGKKLTDLANGEELNQLLNGSNSPREWTFGDSVYTPVIEAASHGWTVLLNDVSHYKRLNHNQSESNMHEVSLRTWQLFT